MDESRFNRCHKCGSRDNIRVGWLEGAYGTVLKPYCRRCWGDERVAYAADMRRCGFRGSLRSFDKLQPARDAPWLDAVYEGE